MRQLELRDSQGWRNFPRNFPRRNCPRTKIPLCPRDAAVENRLCTAMGPTLAGSPLPDFVCFSHLFGSMGDVAASAACRRYGSGKLLHCCTDGCGSHQFILMRKQDVQALSLLLGGFWKDSYHMVSCACTVLKSHQNKNLITQIGGAACFSCNCFERSAVPVRCASSGGPPFVLCDTDSGGLCG